MRNTGLDEAQAGIKIAGRNINNFRYADDTTLMSESEELKSLLMKVKEESKNSWLKAQHSENKDHGIQSQHFIVNRSRNSGNSGRLYLLFFIYLIFIYLFISCAPKSLQMVTAVMN